MMFKKYDREIESMLTEDRKFSTNRILKKHKLMMQRLWNERLIHLLVTFFVGLTMFMSFSLTLILNKLIFILLDIPLFLLFTGYLFHYRFLENMHQKWYLIEDRILAKNVKEEEEN